MTAPKVLLDTNIVIAHVNDEDVDNINAEAAHRLIDLVLRLGFIPTVSHGTVSDFDRVEGERQQRRHDRLKHYLVLDRVPHNQDVAEVFPREPRVQDYADMEVLSAHASGVSSWLVTEDRRMRRRAERVELAPTLSLQDALDFFSNLLDPGLDNVPDANQVEAYRLNLSSFFFDTLKADYPGFENWWRSKVVAHGRTCLVLGDEYSFEGLAVLKPEPDQHPYGLGSSVLKVCTFKVEEGQAGNRRGELLLRAVIDHARHKQFEQLYLSALEDKESLRNWLPRFGFFELEDRNEQGEILFVKDLVPGSNLAMLHPLDVATRYGPGVVRVERAYAIPIRPKFHRLLFPDIEEQQAILPNEPCGNAIRKAYLSRSGIKRLSPGDLLVFIRTGGKGLTSPTAVGVVESVHRSDDPSEIAEAVTGRTVYSYRDIQKLCDLSSVLSVRFRFDRRVDKNWSMTDLETHAGMATAPQTIAEFSEGGTSWIRHQLAASH